MFKKAVLLVVVSAISLLASAQQGAQQQSAKAAPDTSACAFVYSSGSGDSFTRYCLSVNGNIVQFESPSGFEFINFGDVIEGYGFCITNLGAAYYDYAFYGSANWEPTVVTEVNATTRKFVRNTADGNWQLTQVIKQVKANKSAPGSVKITMSLKNLSTVGMGGWLTRVADVDAGATSGNDEFSYTWHSALALEPRGLFGLGLTSNSLIFENIAFTQNTYLGPDPCQPLTHMNFAHFVGDGSIGQAYSVFVPAGATKTVTMTYKPF